MSPVPPPPSNPSPAAGEQAPAATARPTPHPEVPQPLLRLQLRDLSHNATRIFLDNFDAAKDFRHLADTVLTLLYFSTPPPSSPTSTALSAHPSPLPSNSSSRHNAAPKIPGTRSVTLILRAMDGVAYTTGLDLDDDHKEIHLSLSYIEAVCTRKNYDARNELMGVVCHELVHCFQWAAEGTCPGGLIEGVADWVRLNAGHVPPHWKREADGDWDAGYQHTGYFLDWVEKSVGEGSVRKLNARLREGKYDEDGFWEGLFGEKVGQLWKEYGKSLNPENGEKRKEGEGEGVEQGWIGREGTRLD
ncbi:hypothetical protein H2203_008607 [Taxawa tesnikishii (nom. ined.)]|nr:hypothetical protein H2203_008607 [Dothideales sp. JES 119]